MIGRTHSLRPSLCPVCGEFLNAATGAAGADAPHEGDHTVCIACGAMLAFGEAMALRVLTEAEFAALPQEKRTLMMKISLTSRLLPRRRAPPERPM